MAGDCGLQFEGGLYTAGGVEVIEYYYVNCPTAYYSVLLYMWLVILLVSVSTEHGALLALSIYVRALLCGVRCGGDGR